MMKKSIPFDVVHPLVKDPKLAAITVRYHEGMSERMKASLQDGEIVLSCEDGETEYVLKGLPDKMLNFLRQTSFDLFVFDNEQEKFVLPITLVA